MTGCMRPGVFLLHTDATRQPRRFFSNQWLKLLPKHITLPSTNFVHFSRFLFELPLNVPTTLCWISPHQLTFPSTQSLPQQYFRSVLSAVSTPVTANPHKIFVIQNIADSHRRVVSTLWFEFQGFVLCRTLWAFHTWRTALWRSCTYCWCYR